MLNRFSPVIASIEYVGVRCQMSSRAIECTLPDKQNVAIKHTNSDKDPNSKEAIPTVKDDKVKPETLES